MTQSCDGVPVTETRGDTALIKNSATSVWFSEPRTVDLRKEDVPEPKAGEVTVDAVASLVSRGTEMLAYRGELQPKMDLGLPTAAGAATFPIKYGYQVVGRIVGAGPESGFDQGDLVFTRHPHQTRFTMGVQNGMVRRIPQGISVADAVFINLAEVALGCLHDVPIRHGDTVVVFGLGVVGTIACLLAQQAAGSGRVFGVDPVDGRRRLAESMGVESPVTPDEVEDLVFAQSDSRGADVVVEVTGNPAVIQNAIAVCGREGTIAIVSFYGARSAQLAFEDRFHFLRQRIVSCQVGRVGSGLEPRWDRSRRFEVSARLCQQLEVSRMLTHESTIDNAPAAYRFLDLHPSEVTAMAFNYGNSPLTQATSQVQ